MFALNLAAAHDGDVVVLSRKAALDGSPPVLAPGLTHAHPAFDRVHLRCVPSVQGTWAHKVPPIGATRVPAAPSPSQVPAILH